MTITATNESTVSFDNTRWSIGLAREVEWVRRNHEDNLAVVRTEDGYEVGREMSDIVLPFPVGTVVNGTYANQVGRSYGIVYKRTYSGVSCWTPKGVEWVAWGNIQRGDIQPIYSPAVADFVKALWEYHMAQLKAEMDLHRQTVSNHEEFKATVTERFHQEANDRRWCSDFDDIFEEVGLPRRTYEFDVEVDVEYVESRTVTIRVTAESEDDARDKLDTDRVSSAHEGAGHYESISDWNVSDVTQVD